MNLIPYEVYTLNTRLTPDQVSQRLKVSTTPKTLFYFGSFDTNTRATHPFTGSIATNRFEITLNPRRVISFGGLDFRAYTFNSFRPTLRGTIEGDFSGTVIRIRARARTFSYLFMAVWLGFLGFVAGLLAMNQLTIRTLQIEYLPVVLLFMLSGYGFMVVSFSYDNTKLKKALKDALQAEETNYPTIGQAQRPITVSTRPPASAHARAQTRRRYTANGH